MRLSNQRIEDASLALENFRPDCELRIILRLNRNLRALRAARDAKEHDRVRIAYGAVKDRTKLHEPGAPLNLTPDEAADLQSKYQELMATEVEVDLLPVYVIDGLHDKHYSKEVEAFALDICGNPIETPVLTALLDVVLFEPPIP